MKRGWLLCKEDFQSSYECERLVEEFDCNVVVVGLDGDSNRQKFGEILDLIPYCDSCTKISAICKICNAYAWSQSSAKRGA